jgi:hypothetical protein
MKNLYKIFRIFLFSILGSNTVLGQSAVSTFLKPSDTISISRRNAVFITESLLFFWGIVQMNKPFDKKIMNSKFHFVNDNLNSMQMDKVAHVFCSYHIGSLAANSLQWAGVEKKDQLIYGASLGFVYLTTVEIIAGFSKNSGTSTGDIIANGLGTSLYVSQELIWNEQRIIPKFSFETTDFFSSSPREMKSRFMDELDLQNFWLSINLHSFFKESKIPKCLNVAFGYGVERVDLRDQKNVDNLVQNASPYRQIFLSLDVDLTKINTKSHFLKTIFYLFNTIKIPSPTLEYSRREGVKGHLLYF